LKLSNIEKWQRRQAVERRKALDAREMESVVDEWERLQAANAEWLRMRAEREADAPPSAYFRYRSLATPRWLTQAQHEEMRQMYRTAKLMGRGRRRYSVDHIVPLRGLRVCGLHVPWNLEITPLRENQRKNNKHQDGAPGEIRTPDPLVRSQVLYPAELRAHSMGQSR